MMSRIIVAAHKKYEMPESELYLPVHVGSAKTPPLPYAGDDTGDNISSRNDLYCELTALYWAWKNVSDPVIGLCHYRRYFREPGEKKILSGETLQNLMRENSVILPVKRHYWIETGESQFIHAHGSRCLVMMKTVLAELYPDYLAAYEQTMTRRSGHRFNMLIMHRDLLDQYCSWLFDILFETERRLSNIPARMMGYLAERLLDVWIEATKTAYIELPVFYTEKENWVKKGGAFVMRKLRAKA